MIRIHPILFARVAILAVIFAACFLWSLHVADAATLRLAPETGVYTAGGTITMRVVVNTQGSPINAAEGEISFNPADLSVVSISKANSIFSLWTLEPAYSNSAGTISFGGGSPSGYTGAAGTVMTVTFLTKHAGVTNVSYSAGSVLAADGRGTNVISGMQGASYTVQAASTVPAPEYVPPANTPAVPKVTSSTHPDPAEWYTAKTATLSWTLPEGVTSLRTLLDSSESTVPTKVYEEPIKTITIEDLPEGVSYFHIQFRNSEGWGRVAHYRLAVDSEKPESFEILPADDNDPASPEQRLALKFTDGTSGLGRFEVSLDGGDRESHDAAEAETVYTTPRLGPGTHAILIEAFDKAGNSIIATYDLSVDSFEPPVFTDYPRELSRSVIPVIRGTTRPDATVRVTVQKIGVASRDYEVVADQEGVFTFIPEGRFEDGVYELSAVATDRFGAQSEPSEIIRIAVQEPGFVRVFGLVVSVLSVIVPLIGLLILMALMAWYGWHRMGIMRRRIRKEAGEAKESLAREFDLIIATLKQDIEELKAVRKGRLTKQEEHLVSTLTDNLHTAETRVRKEIEDIERAAKRR